MHACMKETLSRLWGACRRSVSAATVAAGISHSCIMYGSVGNKGRHSCGT